MMEKYGLLIAVQYCQFLSVVSETVHGQWLHNLINPDSLRSSSRNCVALESVVLEVLVSSLHLHSRSECGLDQAVDRVTSSVIMDSCPHKPGQVYSTWIAPSTQLNLYFQSDCNSIFFYFQTIFYAFILLLLTVQLNVACLPLWHLLSPSLS